MRRSDMKNKKDGNEKDMERHEEKKKFRRTRRMDEKNYEDKKERNMEEKQHGKGIYKE